MKLLSAILKALSPRHEPSAEPPTGRGADPTFETALHGRLSAQPGNLFYSPASVQLALGMAAVGARGETRAELERTLGLPSGPELARSLGALLADWKSMAGLQRTDEQRRVELRVANRVWAQAGRPFLDEFLTTVREVLHAPLGPVDFAQASEAARAEINGWVSDATEGKISELIAPGQLAPDTRLVLTNAIYFKARWTAPFRATFTEPEPFFVDGTRPVNVPMMHRTGRSLLATVSGAQVLELPYGDGRLVMDLVVPTARDGLAQVEDAYVRGWLGAWLQALEPALVSMTVPRFKIASALELAAALRALGLARATRFPDADFSGVDGTRELFIGLVAHQAVVAVDEDGTEAAAATATAMRSGGLPPRVEEPIEVRADRPFLFVIRDTKAEVVLFAGRLVDPSGGRSSARATFDQVL